MSGLFPQAQKGDCSVLIPFKVDHNFRGRSKPAVLNSGFSTIKETPRTPGSCHRVFDDSDKLLPPGTSRAPRRTSRLKSPAAVRETTIPVSGMTVGQRHLLIIFVVRPGTNPTVLRTGERDFDVLFPVSHDARVHAGRAPSVPDTYAGRRIPTRARTRAKTYTAVTRGPLLFATAGARAAPDDPLPERIACAASPATEFRGAHSRTAHARGIRLLHRLRSRPTAQARRYFY